MLKQQDQNSWQAPVDSLPDLLWDVLVIGAGPAGSMAAIHLASQGHRTLLLDKYRFPRDKTCGDGLIPDAIRCLQRAGIYEKVCQAGRQTKMATVFSPSRIDLEVSGEFLTIKRQILDEILAREAVSRGATFCQGKVKSLSLDSQGMITASFSDSPQQIRTRIAVIAMGADVSLLRQLDMVSRPKASGIAIRSYLRSSFHLDRMIVSFDRAIIPGYAWIFPLANNEYNMGCCLLYRGTSTDQINLKEMFYKFTAEFPLAQALLSQGEMITPLQGAMLRCGLTGSQPLKGEKILAIGESIGATFPCTGEGIGKAMETGELAALVIHKALAKRKSEYLQEFPRLLEEKLKPRYLGYQIAENWLAKAWLNDFMVQRARKSRFLREAFTGILAETIDPRMVFSISGILKSWWK
ncbi:MAG TPA: geranylgeranyl reductase family protein [Candidatus Limnocylindrales bacterium]|nr:geranylgeranyl reductase family protein [Candidatus Limnocylindrales bacterium]